MSKELDALFGLLKRYGVMPAGVLLEQLQRIRPTMSRASLANLIAKAGDRIVRGGTARRTAYGLRRPIRNMLPELPVYVVDQAGKVRQSCQLEGVEGGGYFLRSESASAWPTAPSMADGWYEGIPYMFDDMRPQGFLGRSFAQHHHAILQVDSNPNVWNDDEVLWALSLYGADTTGNYIIGEQALRLYRNVQQTGYPLIDEQNLPQTYAQHAETSMAAGIAGSSAAGEFPKFTCYRASQGQAEHVIVKFSGNSDSAEVRRWSDLLICEHLALETLREHSAIRAAATRIVQHANRTFLEVARFDRVGEFGRTELCSWHAINGAMFGIDMTSWEIVADRLEKDKLIDAHNAQWIRQLHYFGQLIANTDMHAGNLAFQLSTIGSKHGFRVAPAYDMLPMLYAPIRGIELPPREFKPALPLLDNTAWRDAAQCAVLFWERAAQDTRISDGFRAICANNADAVSKAINLL